MDYRDLVFFMFKHTAGERDLALKVEQLQESYNKLKKEEEG